MTKYISILNLDEAEVITKKFQVLSDQSSPILIVDSSIIKSRITTKSLNEAGYFNITVLTDNKKLEAIFKEAKTYWLVFMDGDIGENESFRLYLLIKQKNKNIPKTIFLKEEPSEKWSEYYKKGGSLGCIGRQFDTATLNNLLNIGKPEIEEEPSVIISEFNGGYIIKLKGNSGANQMVELAEQLGAFSAIKTSRCILDFSKAKGIDASIEQILKTSGVEFSKSSRVIEIFDPKNKLENFNFDQVNGIVIV